MVSNERSQTISQNIANNRLRLDASCSLCLLYFYTQTIRSPDGNWVSISHCYKI